MHAYLECNTLHTNSTPFLVNVWLIQKGIYTFWHEQKHLFNKHWAMHSRIFSRLNFSHCPENTSSSDVILMDDKIGIPSKTLLLLFGENVWDAIILVTYFHLKFGSTHLCKQNSTCVIPTIVCSQHCITFYWPWGFSVHFQRFGRLTLQIYIYLCIYTLCLHSNSIPEQEA